MNKKYFKKMAAMLLAAIMVMSALAGCGKKNGDDSSTGTKNTNAPTKAADTAKSGDDASTDSEDTDPVDEEPVIDLGGMEIIIADWWTNTPKTLDTPNLTAQEEARLLYLDEMMKKYNFTVKQQKMSDWGDPHKENFSISTTANDPMAQIWLMANDWVLPLINQGLCYDLSTLDNINLSDSRWNPAIVDQMTMGTSTYAISWGNFEQRRGVFWNKRLFREAGLDPDLPYDLQASGDWTWAEFEKLAEQLTIDKDNDGIPETYGMVNFSPSYLGGAVFSNEAKFIGKDENGKYYNATTEPQLLEALQWAVSLIQKGYEKPKPDPDLNWDWIYASFQNGEAAMQVQEDYYASTLNDAMSDDYGFVLFPKGPNAEIYHTNVHENVAIIPSCYDKETAEKIAFVLTLWAAPTPGYENDWMTGKYQKYRDTRAVEETLAIMYEPNVGTIDLSTMVSGIDLGNDFFWNIFGLSETPQQKIEANQSAWKVYIDEANKK